MDFNKTDKQIKKWNHFLEHAVGILAFSFALGVISIDPPLLSIIACALSGLIISKLIKSGRHLFSADIHAGRSNQDRTTAEDIELKYAEYTYFDNKKYPMYLTGCFSLLGAFVYSSVLLVLSVI